MVADGAAIQPPRRRLRTKTTVPSVSSATCGRPSRFTVKERHAEYVIVKDALDPGLLARVVRFLKKKRPAAAKMKNEGGDSDDERKARYDDRDSRVCWINCQVECPELFKRLCDLVQQVGNSEWHLLQEDSAGRLKCEFEELQYAVYGPKQHFQAWHQDAYAEGHDPEDARQITVVAMLTDRSSFTGGDFEAKVPSKSGKGRRKIRKLPLEGGDALLFPAKRLPHRVSAVKTGIRKTLVFWAYDRASCKAGRKELAEEAAKGITGARASSVSLLRG
eukprot:gnl/TRDRNA2_/TRDRNA2_186616_c0_seq1.p1 gnl/TRDRNA2_/TRDRNA2_186616_c0~~gnl/TRDRNA2_/TRDRNA2_186616_c0_seq1.p1  ORF type:complete len:276 (-),score=55.49 gnl/TRDRNA2_/TRDRNA2_186616_c0_seq1:33-860(-)